MMTKNTELKPINFNMCSNPLDVLFLIFSLCNPIQRNQPEEGKNMKHLMLPYVSEIRENIATSVRKLHVKVAFTSKQTLKMSVSKLTLLTPHSEKTE